MTYLTPCIMSQSTTALLLPEVGAPFELREVFLSPLQPDEVLVEIRATGLCHTDLSFANGTLPCASNAVLGHEGTSNLAVARPTWPNSRMTTSHRRYSLVSPCPGSIG